MYKNPGAEMRCVDHPRYKGAGKPRVACIGCWLKYLAERDYVKLTRWPMELY